MENELIDDTAQSGEAGAASNAEDLRLKALDLLDFPAVRQRLADHTTFFPARRLALELTPSFHSHEVEFLQRETAEGRSLLEQTGDVDLHASADASPAVTRAALGGVLSGASLLGLAESLDVQRRARSTVLRVGQTIPLLMAMAEAIPDLDELQRQIRSRVGRNGDVVDDATPTLGALRSQVRQAYGRVTQALTHVIQSSVGREALQDQVISIRGDRFVVQVKAEMRHRVPGVVHDASNTGATLFIEPFATVDLCNAWRELVLEEEREVQRVLRELSILVGTLADDIRRGGEMTARLDFALARARYSAAIRGVPVFPRMAEGRSEALEMTVRLLNARHPLLATAVPITVGVGPGWSVLVITGPNTGGKTVAMKTVGLLALMHQSGLQISADEGSSLPAFDSIYADVGDQQDIEQSVSTFSSHMRNVIDILAEAGSASLVLLDEIGTSTDPEEGSALAKAILGHLASRGIPTLATTHHHSVAAYAEATAGMMNASVQLDPSTLRPTYHVTMGIPGRSYAISVAARMGLPQEIMEHALGLIEPQYLRFEDWLSELQNERDQLSMRLHEAEEARAQADAIRQDLRTQLEYLVAHREDILDSTRREMLSRYEAADRKLRSAEAALSWRVPGAGLEEAKAEVTNVRRELEAQRVRPLASPLGTERRPIGVGDLVNVRGLNLQGTVASVSEQVREAEVNVGKVHLRMDLSRLSRVEEVSDTGPPNIHLDLAPSLSTPDLDLRGLRAEEALMRLDEFLDKAVSDGLSSVRIIHGRGTGVLRQVVREQLVSHPLARSFAPEAPERGGNGVTVVELA